MVVSSPFPLWVLGLTLSLSDASLLHAEPSRQP